MPKFPLDVAVNIFVCRLFLISRFISLQIVPPALSLIRAKYLNPDNKVFYQKYLIIAKYLENNIARAKGFTTLLSALKDVRVKVFYLIDFPQTSSSSNKLIMNVSELKNNKSCFLKNWCT